MNLYVKWDAENETILYGPQGLKGEGDNWYPYLDSGELVNHRTQTRRYVFDAELGMVLGVVEGSADLTWQQARQAAYGSLEEQLDMLYRDIHNDQLDKTGSFYLFIKGVKDSNPKPGG